MGKAPDKNKPLITEYLAKGASERFFELAAKYAVDALWAGTVEPRIMELLPAVLALKSFRFKHEDVMRLSRLRKNLPARSDTEVIRMALELLEGSA